MRAFSSIVMAIAVSSAAGCSMNSAEPGDVAALPTLVEVGTREAPPATLRELLAESTIVAVVQATGNVTEVSAVDGDAISMTVALHELTVLESLYGDRQRGDHIFVRGGVLERAGGGEQVSELLQRSDKFLLFLKPFEFLSGPTGDFTLTAGPAGIFMDVKGSFRRLDDVSPLPDQLSILDVQAVITSR